MPLGWAWVRRKEGIRNLMKYWRAAYTGQYSIVNHSSHANRYCTSYKRVLWACRIGASIFFQCTRLKHEYKEKGAGYWRGENLYWSQSFLDILSKKNYFLETAQKNVLGCEIYIYAHITINILMFMIFIIMYYDNHDKVCIVHC